MVSCGSCPAPCCNVANALRVKGVPAGLRRELETFPHGLSAEGVCEKRVGCTWLTGTLSAGTHNFAVTWWTVGGTTTLNGARTRVCEVR